eukprot:1754268-Rhodomonas_salina.1
MNRSTTQLRCDGVRAVIAGTICVGVDAVVWGGAWRVLCAALVSIMSISIYSEQHAVRLPRQLYWCIIDNHVVPRLASSWTPEIAPADWIMWAGHVVRGVAWIRN